MVPRHKGLTFKPVLPKFRYSTVDLLFTKLSGYSYQLSAISSQLEKSNLRSASALAES
jgi:hypothetical protein